MASYPQFNQNDYRNNYQPYAGAGANVATMPSVMRRVYLNMTLGLVVTAIVSLFCASQGFVYYMYTHSWVMWALIIAEFGLVIGINGAINKISAGVAHPPVLPFLGCQRPYALIDICGLHRRRACPHVLYHCRHLRRNEPLRIFHQPRPLQDGRHPYDVPHRPVYRHARQPLPQKLDYGLDCIYCRRAHFRRSYSMGYPAHTPDRSRDTRRNDRQGRRSRCPHPLSRLHQPLPLPSPFLRRQPRLKNETNRTEYNQDNRHLPKPQGKIACSLWICPHRQIQRQKRYRFPYRF